MTDVYLTTVMPAYNEGDRLTGFLGDWAKEACRHRNPIATAVVVDDGSGPEEEARQRAAMNAAVAVLRAANAPHRIIYLRATRNQGKGASIRWGWSQSESPADWMSFIDSDGAVPAREYWRVAATLPSIAADVVCGSRILMAGRSVKRSLFRHLQGRTFATAVESLFHLGFYDTQCGMKFFRASLVKPLLPALQEDRWLLDIELLALLARHDARFLEVPIDCHERGGSSLVFGLDPIRMAFRLVRLHRRLRLPAEKQA
jgi:glycosyltransferase involved in cell wall biosynthesis